jgi:glycosyltransferase involved in cell wall biosynthesis
VKVAIVHDWLVVYAGAERVLEHMLRVFPEADLFSLIDFVPETERGFLGGRRPRTSFLQRLPGARHSYRRYLPLMPYAIEQFDLTGYDLVVSSSHAVAKGVLTGPDQLHLCMCYSPMRYAWDLQHQYLQGTGLDRGLKGTLARWMLYRMRAWDARTANGVDDFIAISQFIARRIWKTYRREATVIYPPVDVEGFTPDGAHEDFYVTASRMVPYKRIDLIVEAFAESPGRRLIVIGDGPEASRIRRKAGPNVTFLGEQSFPVLRDHLRRPAPSCSPRRMILASHLWRPRLAGPQ